jgi:hypothetical protein
VLLSAAVADGPTIAVMAGIRIGARAGLRPELTALS